MAADEPKVTLMTDASILPDDVERAMNLAADLIEQIAGLPTVDLDGCLVEHDEALNEVLARVQAHGLPPGRASATALTLYMALGLRKGAEASKSPAGQLAIQIAAGNIARVLTAECENPECAVCKAKAARTRHAGGMVN